MSSLRSSTHLAKPLNMSLGFKTLLLLLALFPSNFSLCFWMIEAFKSLGMALARAVLLRLLRVVAGEVDLDLVFFLFLDGGGENFKGLKSDFPNSSTCDKLV